MGEGDPEPFNDALTTVADAQVPFALSPLWLVDGILAIDTNDLSLALKEGAKFISFAATSRFGYSFVPLHKLLVKPSTGGSHGTITVMGTVVRDLDSYLRRYRRG